jgi:Spy/CpxP family protein refolding chaperone
MKRKSFHIVLVILLGATAVGSFVSTRAQRPVAGQPGLCRWLNVSGGQRRHLNRTGAGFMCDAQELASTYHREREKLAALVADSNSPESQIQTQAQAVIESNNALVRRVVERILVVREHLTEEQRRRFTGFCGGAMRAQGRGRQNRFGPGQPQGRGRGQGFGSGRGQRLGGGRGQGRGRQRGQGGAAGPWQDTGLSRHLALTDAQLSAVAELDPSFSAESDELSRQVQEHHLSLSQLLENTQTDNETVREHLETFIRARSHLEQRTIDHILRIRHLLTSPQKQQLLGLCSGGMGRARGRRSGLGL